MTGNLKTVKGRIPPKVYALVRESDYQELQREVPDMFHNPEIIIQILPDEEFDTMIEEYESRKP